MRGVLLLLVLALTAYADTLTGKVISVADGDTLTVLDHNNLQHKIRLAGIDAPEKAQPFGQRSKQNLSRLTFGKEVRFDWQKREKKFKRIVGKVLCSRLIAQHVR